MAKKRTGKKEWIVTCKISGTCSVFVEAETKEEAMQLADDGEATKDCELNEWTIEDAEDAQLNE